MTTATTIRYFPRLDVAEALYRHSRRYYRQQGRLPTAFVLTPMALAWLRFTESERQRLVYDFTPGGMERIWGVEIRVQERDVLYFVELAG